MKPLSEKTRQARAHCHEHAGDLIDAAARLLSKKELSHIAYHLSLLALEEVGKAGIITAAAISQPYRDKDFVDRWLDSHQRKLQWAIWSPMERLDPSEFEDARRQAAAGHERRLASLYVDPNAEPGSPPPRERITLAEANSMLELAKARLTVELSRGEPSGETSEDLDWWFANADDAEAQQVFFSAASREKFSALGDPKAWVGWVREEIIQRKAEAEKMMQAELARVVTSEEDKIRWQTETLVFTPSHVVRPKILKAWNDKIDLVKLIWINKSDRLLMRITLSDAVSAPDVPGRALMLTKMMTAFLNIGSTGYFWFDQPAAMTSVFKSIRDLENPNWQLEIKLPKSLWGAEQPFPLKVEHIDYAIRCMMAFMPMPDAEAAPIFAPYFRGLAMLGKSDSHVSMAAITHQAFCEALRASMRRFDGWNEKEEAFEDAFHRLFTPIMSDREHRDIMLATLKADADLHEPLSEAMLSAKRLADLYLITVAQTRWREILKHKP